MQALKRVGFFKRVTRILHRQMVLVKIGDGRIEIAYGDDDVSIKVVDHEGTAIAVSGLVKMKHFRRTAEQ